MQQNAPSSGTAIASMMKQAWTGLPLSAVILGSPTSSMHWSFATAWVKKVIFVIRHNLNEDCGLALSSDAFSIALKNMPASFLSPKLLTSHNLLHGIPTSSSISSLFRSAPPAKHIRQQSGMGPQHKIRAACASINLAQGWTKNSCLPICPPKKMDAAPGTTQFLWNVRLQSA